MSGTARTPGQIPLEHHAASGIRRAIVSPDARQEDRMTTKKDLHQLVDELDEDAAREALARLQE